MSDRKQQLEDIFDAVVNLPPSARDTRLDQLCGGDADLRADILSLVAALTGAEDFLENTADLELDGAADQPVDLTGREIGPWRLTERLGAGGTGDVWLAVRTLEGAEQRVALKIIRTAILAPDAMRRFRNECRVLAMLEHPGIARLIEGAVTPEGLPYLAIEYVEGTTLDTYCDERELDTRDRLGLMVEVCAAVRHLHRHSVIHRDIKPANILVGADGRVKLIDFGIARVLDLAGDEADLTLTGMERMTPRYASPEQLRGELLTTGSDVYSLGVVAYRLLTGTHPFMGRQRRELEREITAARPTAPSAAAGRSTPAAGALRGDLDTIILMALRKEPERRYPSVQAFREDMVRHLEGLPVLARGDSFTYVAGKFVRRHAVAVAAAALALLILMGATISGFSLYQKAERERATAAEVGGFLEDLLGSANPTSSDARVDLTVIEILDEAAERIERDLGDQPAVAASLRLTIGSAYLNLGKLEKARSQLDAARQIKGSIDVDLKLADIALKQGRYGEMGGLLAHALDAGDPDQRAIAHMTLVRVRTDESRLDDALAHTRLAGDAAAEPGSSDPMLPAQIASLEGMIRHRQGHYAEAESLMAAAVELARTDLGNDHVLVGEFTQNLGVILTAQGRPDDAVVVFEQALVVFKRVYPPGHNDFGILRTNLGRAHFAAGRPDTALVNHSRARAVFEKVHGMDSFYWGISTGGMARCHHALGRLALADSLYDVAITVQTATLTGSHPWVANARSLQGRLRLDRGRPDEAAPLAEQALAALEASFPDGHPDLAHPLVTLAEAAMLAGRDAAARALLERADAATASLPPATAARADVLSSWQRHREAVADQGSR